MIQISIRSKTRDYRFDRYNWSPSQMSVHRVCLRVEAIRILRCFYIWLRIADVLMLYYAYLLYSCRQPKSNAKTYQKERKLAHLH